LPTAYRRILEKGPADALSESMNSTGRFLPQSILEPVDQSQNYSSSEREHADAEHRPRRNYAYPERFRLIERNSDRANSDEKDCRDNSIDNQRGSNRLSPHILRELDESNCESGKGASWHNKTVKDC
jgi:hypothetical protein